MHQYLQTKFISKIILHNVYTTEVLMNYDFDRLPPCDFISRAAH